MARSEAYTYTTPQESMPQIFADSYDTRLAVRQTLFDAGATANLLKTIEHSITAQEHEVRRTELDIVLAIRTTFMKMGTEDGDALHILTFARGEEVKAGIRAIPPTPDFIQAAGGPPLRPSADLPVSPSHKPIKRFP